MARSTAGREAALVKKADAARETAGQAVMEKSVACFKKLRLESRERTMLPLSKDGRISHPGKIQVNARRRQSADVSFASVISRLSCLIVPLRNY